ncbi:DUF3180 domain-containing protein [Micrococcus flavus]|uniref:Regulator of protease activity HflC (Stomatin/prohibitin superfamily) n=1 Tax=Micrococcus flavus TaxID=384602 RepID=A0A4Y8X0C4_9MICC|nr:DUF3180 domain-containing protein [Micrococcus flavus]MBB4883718.1 regulator of protease activity HflC (stomatin/prohibitin superfamily) [Micrococcus flavus]TFI00597.1 DUF3180 domain-containing protein [Micrococcus flavus]GGK48183.1 hypothetical protein GCM10007073_14070 [Micrococcus flavus]
MITLLSWRTPLLAAAAAVLGWLCALASPALGLPAPVMDLAGLVTVAAVGVLCLVLGLRVRRDRERPLAGRMDPIAAARTLVLGQASGLTGAALAGWHVGAGLEVAGRAGLEAPAVLDAGLLVLGGAALLVVGVVVERWCRIPPGEDGEDAGPGQDGRTAGGRNGRRPEAEGGYARARD